MDSPVNPTEAIKANSHYLRGTLHESITDQATGALNEADAQISKFHGFYQQDDRDLRRDRQERLLEPYYSFMLRARLPGGICSSEQWLAIVEVANTLGNGSIRLTTRQTFQYHGILKHNLKPLIARINQAMIDSIGGCGDINRNVLCNPNPEQSALHAEVYQWASRISEHLLPQTRAYHEIWLDGERLPDGEHEPIYGNSYLPRKFKTAIAIPPNNDVDIYTNDLGFIAIVEAERLVGFNLLTGGGMGTTHDDPSTFPRLADTLGFITPEQTLAVAEAVVTTQRDFGDRVSRRHARLKYTIERLGIERFRREVEHRAGIKLQPPRPVTFTTQGDRIGWQQRQDKRWNLTLYIENGRLVDRDDQPLLSGLREIALIHPGSFRITPNQNLVIADIATEDKARIEQIARTHGLIGNALTPLRQASIACVALPTCPQAMAEAERAFPHQLSHIEAIMQRLGLKMTEIIIRVTGCPNGCARPYVAEVGLIGKGPGHYNLHIGGDGRGERLNRLYRKNLSEDEILNTLEELLEQYRDERHDGERFGDFVIRAEIVKPVINPAEDYHDHHQ